MPKPIILCVDDEKIILESIKRQLKEEFGQAYQYEFAENAEDAMELMAELEEENEEILVIVSDWLMPGKKGDEFLMDVHKQHPNMVKIMLTGQADDDAIERAKKQANIHRFLRKPWNEEELVETIKSGLEKFV
ncbi:MAG: response regulator [Candidatus Parabeggiatoa sp. nov. 3]|nr:MAG: response regulator [Gammaproteobacteria bacterium]RKZ59861.1 MAG: response regulator [Gammaproteobacteria bacterium]RKZ79934.1 MAG: response regulator [Gammaproteobacteria bacterium]HEW98065.1 response regulator [Beggiatoa sp.]